MAEVSIDTSSKSPLKKLLDTPVGTIIASVTSTFIIATLFFKFAGPVPISVQQTTVEKQSTFDTTGEGSASVTPDMAQVSLGITTTQSSVAQAQDETNKVINSITKELEKNGVDSKNIKTQNYSINPQYNLRGDRRVTGYTVNASLRVKITDFSKLNQAIDSAVTLGANQVGGITFTLSDDEQQKAEEVAREEAVEKAKTKAKSLAKAAGIKLGRIINVQEHSGSRPPIMMRSLDAMAESAPDAQPTEIQPGSTEVKLSITLSYETL